MICRDYRTRLDVLEDYLEGRLATSDQAQLSEHLSRCEPCARALAAAQLATQVLREARLPYAPEPSPGFAQRVTARLRVEQQAIADFWRSLEVFARRVSWAAAVLLLILGGYFWTLDQPAHQQRAQQEPAEVQEIFPEPYQRPANQEEVLLSLTSNGTGR
jgi:anti-sigma factor RsiW